MGKRSVIWLILIFGLVLRLVNLGQSFWLDEASQAMMSARPVAYIWSSRPADFHPPLFYLMAHYWLYLGRSEIWLRLLPVSFGVLNIYLIYLFAGQFFTKNGRLLSAVLLAISPFHIYYSQEFRSYSLLCLLGTLSMYLFYRRRYLWLVVINALILYTHYSGIFLIGAQFIYWILFRPRDFRWLLLNIFGTFILYLPWVPQFMAQIHSGTMIDEYLPGWRQVLSITPVKAFPVIFFKLVAGRINFLSAVVYGIYIVFIFSVTFLALIFTKIKNSLLYTWAFVPLFLLLFTSLVLPQNQPFRVIFVLPALILLFTGACLRHPKLMITFFIYIALVGNITYYTRPRLQREQWRQAIGFLQKQSAPVLVKFSDKFAPFYWYAPDLPIVPAVPSYPARPVGVTDALGKMTAPKIYLLQYLSQLTDPDNVTESVLEKNGYHRIHTYDYPGVGFIDEFSRT